MAVNVSLNTPEVWRSVVTYQNRKRNPEATWENKLPPYLDEWDEELHADVRGPYTDETAARVQAGRDASERARAWAWAPGNERVKTSRVVSVTAERSSLAWQECGRRDPDTKKWEAV
ncbi:hypothetical protein ACQEVG_32890 [Streptomyces sp. CA-135486]|uniref:hypothetical protein n=1 Tax=Streptomyces sp. CA-135486 TaxID=3240049 RepID=UPI003D92A2E5